MVCRILAALAVAMAAEAGTPHLVVIHGRLQHGGSGDLYWTVREHGAWTRLGYGDSFKVPAGRTFLLTEASLIVHAGPTEGDRAANVRIEAKEGFQYKELAGFTARLQPMLRVNTLSKRFRPPLPLPAGAEVRAGLLELQPAGRPVRTEVTFYGYYD